MTYRDLFLTAVGMTGEEIDGGEIGDYEDCAPYLLATFCRECAAIDARYRAAHSLGTSTVPKGAYVDMEDNFPLCDALTPAASYYLASMLVADENEELSDRFFTLYTDAISAIVSTLPASCAPIADCYRLLK